MPAGNGWRYHRSGNGTAYHALGSQIDVVEVFYRVIPAADKDIVKVFTKRISKKFNLMLETKVTAVEAKEDGIYVTMEGKKAPAEPQRYDAVLVAIGRVPNGKNLDAGKAGVEVDDRGFIRVDKQLRTNVPHIFAIGEHRRSADAGTQGVHEGHVAAEVIAGKKHYSDPKVIPSIAYTEPEVAWVGRLRKKRKRKASAMNRHLPVGCFWSCHRFRLRRRYDQADFRQRISPCDWWCNCRY
ncbi:FAD-dependent oxidoreductase [Shigella sonnei]